MEWTSEERLRLILALVEKSFDDGPMGEHHRMLRPCIMYLCMSSAEFLELNKRKFEDVLTTPPKGQLECLSTSEISCGDLIAATITKDGHFTIHPANPGEEIIIGTSARNIQTGDTVNYIPNQNTSDILVKTDGLAEYAWSFDSLNDQLAARARMDDAMEMKSISGEER